MVRVAWPEDIPALVEMGRALHETAKAYPFVEKDCAAFFKAAIEAPEMIVFRTDGGFICGTVIPQPQNNSHRVAYEIFFWSGDKTGKALREAFEEWGVSQGCKEIEASYPAGSGAASFFERAGYTPVTQIVGKDLPCA